MAVMSLSDAQITSGLCRQRKSPADAGADWRIEDEKKGLKHRMVLAITARREQTHRYGVFIRVSEFQTFLHNTDCQLKHFSWLALCCVKNGAVGCQPVIQLTICSSHCRRAVFGSPKQHWPRKHRSRNLFRLRDSTSEQILVSFISSCFHFSRMRRFVSTKSPAWSRYKYTPLENPFPSN